MKCMYHRNRDALGTCISCGKGLCADCLVEVKNKIFCRTCLKDGKIEDGYADSGTGVAIANAGLIMGIIVICIHWASVFPHELGFAFWIPTLIMSILAIIFGFIGYVKVDRMDKRKIRGLVGGILGIIALIVGNVLFFAIRHHYFYYYY